MSLPKLDKSLWGGTELDRLLLDIRERREEFEQQRFISHDIIERYKNVGIYRAFVPTQFGGDERTPVQFLQLIETIASADGSAGWVASFGMNPAYLSALPHETIAKVWANGPDVVFAGGIFPPKPAVRKDGGFLVNGRWQFGSGCMGASLIGVGIQPEVEGALPRMAVLPRDKVTIDQNSWNVHGMTATGSFDLVVEDVVVPEEWTFVRGAPANLEGHFFNYPSLSLAAQVLSVTSAGVAREALDLVYAMGGKRASVTGAPDIGDRQYVQTAVAKAEARLQSARAFFYDATEAAWDSILSHGEVPPLQTSMLRLSTSHLTHECAEVTRAAYKLAGMTSAYYSHPLSRCFRDAHLATQHAFMGEITFQNAGAMLFGKQPLPGYL
ncbi:acyl-CoA dehydrogenase family protein [Halioxenophilus aromaticivorans]|uniref:Acyl-CoA dehydrogenase family protein n=1 Tax=Halioxenophilus aromaticivorans TaxID=1306992 RepID=A0AAV3U5C4_9ALTE